MAREKRKRGSTRIHGKRPRENGIRWQVLLSVTVGLVYMEIDRERECDSIYVRKGNLYMALQDG